RLPVGEELGERGNLIVRRVPEVRQALRPAEEQAPILLRYAQELAEDDEWQLGGDLGDELALGARDQPLEDAGHHLADGGLHLPDRARAEGGGDEPAVGVGPGG